MDELVSTENQAAALVMQHGVALQTLNTFGISATSEFYVKAEHEADFQVFLRLPEIQALPKTVLGGGSNILLVGDVKGLVIHNCILGRKILEENADSVVLAAGGGEIWHEIVLYAIIHGWGGLENLSLIPGLVGAAPIQNIGAYGVEIKDVFSHLRAIHLQTGEIREFYASECNFGYRDSVFKQELKGQYMVLEVAFVLRKSPHILNLDYGAIRDELAKKAIQKPTILDVSDAIIAIRQNKLPDPKQIGNAGSFFKNPEIPKAEFERLKAQFPSIPGYAVDEQTMKIAAGWLIEQAGWKGKRFGNHGVHAQQALVLVNYGGANGAEILALSTEIMADVFAKYGIALEREVNVLGN